MTANSPKATMSPWSAFKRGTERIWLHKRLILWLYLVNLAFAAVLIKPMRSVVEELSKTDLADDFVSGFQIDSFAHYWSHYSPALKSLVFSAVGLGGLYLIASIFLGGGIVAALAVERRVSLRRFFTDAGRYFGRFFRLFVLLIVVFGVLGAGYELLLADTIEDMREAATTGRASFLWKALGVAVVVICGSLALMVFDYAKIRLVADRRRSSFVAVAVALAFSVRRCWRTVPLFGLNVLAVVLLFTLYLLVENLFSNATLASMIGLFFVQQVFILSRIWMKLSFYSTQMAYYQSISGRLIDGRQEETVSS